jgi:PPOX class probable F420-dependent enzyme
MARNTAWQSRVDQRMTTVPKLSERAAEPIGWLTTVTPSGKPAPRPVWFVLDGEDIVVFSQPETAKLRHIAQNPHVSFHLKTDGHGDSVLVVNGRARVESGVASDLPDYLAKYRPAYARIGFDSDEAFDRAYSVRIRITPERTWGW